MTSCTDPKDDRWTFRRCLREAGIEMYLDANGGLRARTKVDDPEIAQWIRDNRAAIIAELRNPTRAA